jgi:hypothetical protein
VLRGRSTDSDVMDFGTFPAGRNGPHLLFLRVPGKPAVEGFLVIRGAEFVPQP